MSEVSAIRAAVVRYFAMLDKPASGRIMAADALARAVLQDGLNTFRADLAESVQRMHAHAIRMREMIAEVQRVRRPDTEEGE